MNFWIGLAVFAAGWLTASGLAQFAGYNVFSYFVKGEKYVETEINKVKAKL